MKRMTPRALLAGCFVASIAHAALAQPTPMSLPGAQLGNSPIVKVQGNPRPMRKVRRQLRDRGFKRVVFREKTAPYLVQACSEGTLLSMRVTQDLVISEQKKLGICGRSDRFGPNSAVVREIRQRGFSRLQVIREDDRRTVFLACKDGLRQRVIVTPNGKIRRTRATKKPCDRG